MNRQIKFRAFVRGYIVDVVSIDFINQYITWDDNQYDRCVPPNKCYEIASFDEIKLLQWTGLYDKNGKEIFEGDVVKCHDHPTGVEDGIFQVEFLEGAFRTGRIILGDWGTAWIEVIGSIFTHPELVQTIK